MGWWLRAGPLELDSLGSALSPATYCVIWSKLLNLSKPQFSLVHVIPVKVQQVSPHSGPEAAPGLR